MRVKLLLVEAFRVRGYEPIDKLCILIRLNMDSKIIQLKAFVKSKAQKNPLEALELNHTAFIDHRFRAL